MLTLPGIFHEQDNQVQQLFDEWTPFEQIYSLVELTRKLQLSYRHFLSQLLSQSNNQQENNDMFYHTVHQANTPAILACLLSDPLDKIISTLQLYLPLVSPTTTNEKLLEAYRDVFIYLDSQLTNPLNFTYTEQQLISFCQQIKFFIQINPCLQKYLIDVPQLNALASSATIINKEALEQKSLSSSPSSQRHPSTLQCYPSIRHHHRQQISSSPPPPPLVNFISEGLPNGSLSQPLIRHVASDSGIDLTEPSMTNSVQNILSAHDKQNSMIGRSHSDNLALVNGQDNQHNHIFVGKTASSPTPEQKLSCHSPLMRLSAVLSAPAQSIHSYYSEHRHQNSSYSQQNKPTLVINDENKEEELSLPSNYQTKVHDKFLDVNTPDTRNRLRPSYSLHNRGAKGYFTMPRNMTESVSPYLGVEGDADSVPNTFIQPNSGMRDVPKWLKNLRLHKYAFFFSQMTYEQMMNLTFEQLKERKITDGACTKILLNIKKLKERKALLQQCLIDIENGHVDTQSVLQQLNELLLTPIRAKKNDSTNDDDEDLPKLIMQVIEEVYKQLTCDSTSTTIMSELCNNLVGLFDRCYKHEAFTDSQRLTLLQWRGPLCNKLQTSGKIEFKSMQPSSSTNRRVQLKPQSSMGNINTTQIARPTVRNIKSTLSYYSNYSSNSVPLSRQHNSDLPNSQNGAIINNTPGSKDANFIRRPIKSPAFMFTISNDANDDSMTLKNHLSVTSTPSLQEQILTQQSSSFITERSGNGTGNLRPTFNYVKQTPQTNANINKTYLATNQHQLLTRKKSIDPHDESNSEDKTKLCKTYSDPSKIRFYNSMPIESLQSPSNTQILAPQTSYRMTSTPYASHTQSTKTNSANIFESDLSNQTSIQQSYSDVNSFYGTNSNSSPASSNDSNTHDITQDYHQHSVTEFEKFCRQLTESALNDDRNKRFFCLQCQPEKNQLFHNNILVKNMSIDCNENSSNNQTTKTSSNNSTDTEEFIQ